MNIPQLTDSVISIRELLINLGVGTILSLILAAYYVRFGRTHSNRTTLALVIPLIVVTTLFVITVVKSSLALSLGLVGALSIVRFRTPIKEPEELAYLFLAIAIGLGLGAGQTLATIAATIAILLLMLGPYWWSRKSTSSNTFVRVHIPETNDGPATFTRLVEQMAQGVSRVELRRMDLHDEVLEATFLVTVPDEAELARIVGGIKQAYPNASVTFVAQTADFMS